MLPNLPYIKVFENVLHEDNCKALIKMFEDSEKDQIKRDIEGYIKFTEINFNQHKRWAKIVESMVKVFSEYYLEYKKQFDINELQFPTEYGLEEMRMKRYLPNDYDEFKLHVDVNDSESSKRYLSYLLYLNDVEEGGETTFGRDDDFIIKPKAGNMLMFPPLWCFPHSGKKPISGPKYILTCYVNYINEY